MIEIEHGEGSSAICRPTGDLDLYSATWFRHVISDLMRPDLNLVVDLRHAAFMDAVGLSALAGSMRRVRAAGGTARVTHVHPRLRWPFRLVGIERLVVASPTSSRPAVA